MKPDASQSNQSRRNFLRSAVAVGAGAAFSGAIPLPIRAAENATTTGGNCLKKAVKFGMVAIEGSVAEKFALLKELGFEGCEMDSPSDVDRKAAKKASDETGVKIHGVIDSVHWAKRLSDPDEAVRAAGLEALQGALKDAKFYGADTVLLVPGAVRDPQKENFEQAWERSTAEIKKAIPLAGDLGVKIAIEVVWNDFITKPEQLVKYVDQFETPSVGAYFDVSNMIKYGVPPATWIRQLGDRMLKFDFKGYSNANQWVDIGQGDEEWPEVLKALKDINYCGWATSEVKGGDKEYLKKVAEQMNQVLGLTA